MSQSLSRREVLYTSLNQLTMVAGTVLSVKLFTNLLSLEEYGLLALALAIAASVQIIYSSISNSILRFLPVARDKGETGLFSAALKTMLMASLAIPPVVLLVIFVILSALNEPLRPSYVLAVLIAAGAGLLAWAQTLFLAMRDRGRVLIFTVILYVLRPVSAAVLLILISPGALLVLWAYLATQSVALIYAWVASKQALRALSKGPLPSAPDKSTDYRSVILSYSSYFLVSGIFMAGILQVDRFILEISFGLRELGLYSGMFSIAAIAVNMAHSFMSQLMTPVIFQRWGDPKSDTREGLKAYRTFLIISTGIFFSLVLGMTVLRQPVVLFLTNDSFLAVAHLVPLLTLAHAIEKLGQSVTVRGFADLNTWPYLWTRVVQLAALAGCGLLGVHYAGLTGMALAQIAASLLYFLSTLLTNRNLARKQAAPEKETAA